MVEPKSTNTTTHFLRETRAMQIIRDLVAVPNTAAKRKTVVWSVGCSSGDEPYSLAMLCREAGASIEILATDINPTALERARRGWYPERNLRHVDATRRERWFTRTRGGWEVVPELREIVKVREHDICNEAAPRHDVDVVLCRNVMVYFNAEEVRRAVGTMAASLRPGALCIFGASEWLRGDLRMRGTTRLVPIEKSGVIVYQRDDAEPPRRPSEPARVQVTGPIAAPPPPPPPASPSRWVEDERRQGDAHLDAGRPAEARACYARAVELAPLLADLQLRIALCHLHLGEPAAARDALRRALFLTPGLWQAWLLMADLAHEPDQVRHCLDQARGLLETGPGPSDAELAAFTGDRQAMLAAIDRQLRVLRRAR
ncbi:MAG: CheR family methyltransferase [Kofleriaceae bacterium]|nr:CheR family methyltransferase [Kofleriaceae bacterium]